MIDFRSLLVENIILSIPFSILFILFALLLCGFKDRITIKSVASYTLILTIIDVIFTIALQKYGMQTIPYIILSSFVILIVAKIDYLSSLISVIFSAIYILVTQTLFFIGVSFIEKMELSNFISYMENNTMLKVFSAYIYYLITFLIALLIYKKDIKLIDLKRYKLLNIVNNKFAENIKLIVIVFTPMVIFIFISFSIHYYQAFNDIKNSPLLYFLIDSLALLVSGITIFYLIKRIIKLRYLEVEWQTQQRYLNDVNELLKRLREQKHGFINHLNILNCYISLEQFDKAKEYLLNIQQVVSTSSNTIDVNNPALNTLLNVKSKCADKNNIPFSAITNIDLSQFTFNIFEVGEAIGNIIDNAIEASCHEDVEKRDISIEIYSSGNYYVLSIQNTGKTIPKEVLDKIFDEGFTTKGFEHGEHGLGLYISKKIIELNRGKIEVESKDSKTSFKIYLPKVVKNEIKFS